MEPHSVGCPGSGSVLECVSGSRSMEIDLNLNINVISSTLKRILPVPSGT
jgi:hypothetical protein